MRYIGNDPTAPVSDEPKYIRNGSAELDTTGWNTYNNSLTATTVTGSLAVDELTDFINSSGFAIPDGTKIVYSSHGGAPIGGLTLGQEYYVYDSIPGVGFSLEATLGGGPVNLTSDGTGPHVFRAAVTLTGTGGVAGITWTRTTSSPLRNTASFLFTKDATNRQGEGASYDFEIDRADRAKLQQISFDYEIASGTYADDIYPYIIDTTNNTIIQPVSGYQLKNVGIASRHLLTFQTSSNSTSYRLCLHVATASALAYSIIFDGFNLDQPNNGVGTAASDWIDYTPTATLTNSLWTGKWRRVGDTMECQIRGVFAGASTGSSLALTIPSGYTIDTNKIPNTAFLSAINGTGFILDASAGTYYSLHVGYQSPTAVFCTYDSGTLGQMLGVTASLPFAFAVSDTISLTFQVPIVGWASATSAISGDSGRVVAAKMYRNAALTLAPNNTAVKVNLDAVEFDTHGAANTTLNRYDVKEAGYYDVTAQVSIAASNVVASAYFTMIAKNGTIVKGGASNYQSTGAQSGRFIATAKLQCNAGDYIEVYFFSQANHSTSALTVTNSSASTTLEVSKIASGSGAVLPGETVACKYTSSTTTIGTTTTTLIMPTKVYDTHGAYNPATGIFTAPVPGKYRISGGYASSTAITSTTANRAVQINMTKGGSSSETTTCAIYYWPATSMQLGPQLWGSATFELLAQDTLRLGAIRATEVPSHSASGSSSLCWVSIERIG